MSQSHRIVLESAGFPATALAVVKMAGREQISQPYAFELTLCSDSCGVDYDAVVGQPATLQLGKPPAGRLVHGVIAELELGDRLADGRYGLQALLVPRLKLLDLGRQSRVFQHLSVPEIVSSIVLKELRSLIAPQDLELRLSQEHRQREYVVQYQESSLAFISRLLEDEGISYFFEQVGPRERLVLCDHNPAFTHTPELAFGAGVEAAGLSSLRLTRRVLPGRVLLRDYDESEPHVPLHAEAEIDGAGFGLLSEHNAGFSEPLLGRRVARLRAEETRCQGVILRGSAGAVTLQAGGCFELSGHFREDFNRELLVTGLRHRLEAGRYQAELEAIFADTPYRPPRQTPKPRLSGAMNAIVDASGPGETAAVDEQGRYRVVMPFDQSGAGEGAASPPIRMAQPYGGPSQGMHFPLPKGAEVVWTGLDGDPDRPIITGAVPNAGAPSVVTQQNAGSAVIETSSGARMEFRDRLTALPRRQAHHLGQLHAAAPTFVDTRGQDSGARTDRGGRDTWFKIHIPHTSGAYSYFRYGEEPAAADETPQADATRRQFLADTLKLNIRGATPASSTASNAGPYTLPSNLELLITVDGGTEQTISLSHLTSPADATTVSSAINAGLSVGTASASVSDGKVIVTSQSEGRKSKIKIDESGSDSVFGFPASAVGSNVYDDKSDIKTDWDTSGVFDYTDRNRTIVTRGNKENIVDGKYREEVQGNVHRLVHGKHRFDITGGALGLRDASVLHHLSFKPLGYGPGWDEKTKKGGFWRKKEVSHSSSLNVSYGDSESYHFGYNYGFKTGIDIGASVALSGSTTLGASVNYAASASVSISAGMSYSHSVGPSITECLNHSVTAGNGIVLSVDSGSAALSTAWSRGLWGTFGAVMGLSLAGGLILGTVPLAFNNDEEGEKKASDQTTNAAGAWGYGVAPALMAVAALVPIARAIARAMQPKNPLVPKIEIHPLGIRLSVGALPATKTTVDLVEGCLDIRCGKTSTITMTPASIQASSGSGNLQLDASGGKVF